MEPLQLSPDSQRAVTQERLRLLSLAYYISGAIGAICVSFLIIHLTLFTVLSCIPESKWNSNFQSKPSNSHQAGQEDKSQAVQSNPPPLIIFRIAAGVIGFIILVGWTLGGLTIYAGRCIKRRRQRTFVLIMAGINCLWIPYGTLLGIATFLTLSAPDAKDEYPS